MHVSIFVGFSSRFTAFFKPYNAKIAGLFPAITGGDGLSRYRTDFHEIEVLCLK